MDAMTMELPKSNNNNNKSLIEDSVAGGPTYPSLQKINENNGGNDDGGGGEKNSESVVNDHAAHKDYSSSVDDNQKFPKEQILGKLNQIFRTSFPHLTAGDVGAGDAPYLGPLGGGVDSVNTNYDFPELSHFLSPQTLQDVNFGNVSSASLQMREIARKQIFQRQFRQVEMGCPAGTDCYSRKVFVGGLPPDIDETAIQTTFLNFGSLVVDWPHKPEMNSPYPPKGFVFLLFFDHAGVKRLIDACSIDNGRLYMNVSSLTIKNKPVEVRPWRLADADYIQDMKMTLDPRKTVFIGGVPRPIKAYELALIMNRLFGRVCYAGIDTDPEMKYPKGAGRVTFFSHHSYVAAISARFVQLQHQHIDKRVEIKPYVLDDQECDECKGTRCSFKYARFFCSNTACLRYYCDACWTLIHARPGHEYHKPLVKEYGDRPRAVPYCWYYINKN